MKMLTTLCSVLVLATVVQVTRADYGTIQRVSILTSICEDCGMTAAGQLNLKICGGNSEKCCAVVNIGDFDSDRFNQGQWDDYTGQNLLEDCYNYRLDKASSPNHVSVTVYHEGSFDGVQLDYVDIVTDFVTIRCPQGVFMGETSSYTSACYLN